MAGHPAEAGVELSKKIVMRGLDPRIHLLRKESFERG
jgi:hypothetical protein